MKRLTYHGPGHVLDVPGYFKIARGESIEVDDSLARTLLIANPHLALSADNCEAAEPDVGEEHTHLDINPDKEA